MLGLSDIIMWCSDNVLDSGSIVRIGLLELDALSVVCARVANLDAVLHKLDTDKGLFFVLIIVRAHSLRYSLTSR